MCDSGIKLKEVNKFIGEQHIIKNINFEIKKGEIFGLLGPNGAGKTTTIKMITGLSKISKGEILICDKNLKRGQKVISHIGAIVENPSFYDYLSGYTNLKLYSKMFRGISSKDIEKAIQKVGLEKRIKEKVGNYSLGMKQRLGIALAMVHNPDILILDEPTNGLDPAGTISMRKYLKELAYESNVAILISSHLLNEMENICDRVGIMYKGRLLRTENLADDSSFYSKVTYRIETNDNKLAAELLDLNIEKIDKENSKIYIKSLKSESDDILTTLMSNKLKIYDFSLIKRNLEDHFLDIIKSEEEGKF